MGVFPTLALTSASKKLLVATHPLSSMPLLPTGLSDMFNDLASPYGEELGYHLRETLRDYLYDSLVNMSFSIHGNVQLLEYNTKLLKLVRELTRRGFFSGYLANAVKYDTGAEDAAKGKGKAKAKAKAEGDNKKGVAIPFGLGRAPLHSASDLKEIIVQRVLLMDAPKEDDTHYNPAAVGEHYIIMIDAAVDVLHETVEMIMLERVEALVQLFSAQHDGQRIHIPDTTREDLKLSRALAIIFAALPERLEPTLSETVARKVHTMIFDQVNQSQRLAAKLGDICLFQTPDMLFKARQLVGLGEFIQNNLYVCLCMKICALYTVLYIVCLSCSTCILVIYSPHYMTPSLIHTNTHIDYTCKTS